MEKITFKQYLESKEKLKKAIKESPVRIATYSVKKYCKIPVGESKDEKEYVHLKPKQKIIVEWKYTDINNPDVLNVRFDDVTEVDSNDEYTALWSNNKLQTWLKQNTREE